jgi:hypothetical protein
MKMKTKRTEHRMVEYFLVSTKNRHAEINAVCRAVMANRLEQQGFWNLIIWSFGFIMLALIFKSNIIEIPYNQAAMNICCLLAFIGAVIFLRQICEGYWKLKKFYRRRGYNESAANEIFKAIDIFENLFGQRPEKLGVDGVTKKLTVCAKRILSFKTGGDIDREAKERERFKEMHDAASVFMPVDTYEDIFLAAEIGRKKTYMTALASLL